HTHLLSDRPQLSTLFPYTTLFRSWLEEQSKRVQELEDINSQLGYLLGKVYGQSNFEINDLIKQNKRYREKMQEAKEMASCCGMSAVSILEEALEESK